jgi:hypothetical protein
VARRRSRKSGKNAVRGPRRAEPSEPVYVEHPRWGARPRRTGVDVIDALHGGDAHLHWLNLSPEGRVIRGTAVAADLTRQTPATIPVTHYYDLERTCRDCGRLFLFFAVEQKHWYEELGFPLEAECVRCHPCRKQEQEIKARHERYQELMHREQLAPEQEAELALLRLDLIEASLFGVRQAELVRAFLNRFPDHPQAAEIRDRLARLVERA